MDLQTFTELGSGLLVSLEIFFLTLLFSLPLGMVVAFGRMSKNRILSAVTKFYISVMRGTPLMLQLIVVYFGPYYLFRIRVGADYRFIAVILAFVLNYAAYFAEIYRSGLQAMPKGQYEAAKVLGYSKTQTFFHIILPQLIKQVLPSVYKEINNQVNENTQGVGKPRGGGGFLRKPRAGVGDTGGGRIIGCDPPKSPLHIP